MTNTSKSLIELPCMYILKWGGFSGERNAIKDHRWECAPGEDDYLSDSIQNSAVLDFLT